MSLTRKHFTDLADLIVHIKTHEFGTDQDLINFVKVEIVRFCYDHGVNFNRNTFESYISNHVQKAGVLGTYAKSMSKLAQAQPIPINS